ncbi:MAG: hypothetical protein KGL75_03795, partial [Acidobacteriota bacterium]|nr:hypothetical protein [Acidobacteriota bacterium]
MRRFNVTELHERPWFPQFLRDLFTEGLQFILNAGRIYEPIAEPLAGAISAAGATRVVDLCSGAGGPWLWLRSALRARLSSPLEILLTDKYPNIAAFEYARRRSLDTICFSSEQVDAAQIGREFSGFRTLFGSLHHFSPGQVVSMLQDAADQRQGFGAFDAARRRAGTIAAILLVPAGVLLTAPFIRPFRFSRLFWTYLLPVVPIVLFVDGILSCLRAYSPVEMKQFCSLVSAPGYMWDAGEAS